MSRAVLLVLLLPALVLGLLRGPPGADAAAAPHGGPAGLARGDYGWPLPGLDREAGTGPPRRGTVTRRFGAPPTPYGRGHRGVDLTATPTTPVIAAGAGVVDFAGPGAGRGVVSVRHGGGLRTTYEPVTPAVAAGATVARGTPLGVLEAGHAGCPSAACLHWGLRRAVPGAPGGREQYLDPLLLLGLGRMRLLPWAVG